MFIQQIFAPFGDVVFAQGFFLLFADDDGIGEVKVGVCQLSKMLTGGANAA